MVGNPPFAGKNTLIASHPPHYADWLKALHAGAHGNADLVAHFFRRAFDLLRRGGAFGLIATNTIRQGDTRATGLRPIRAAGGTIYRALRRTKWPGEAAVVIAVVHVHKGPLPGPFELDGREVDRITAFLFHAGTDADPEKLAANANKSFVGSYVLGMGFTFDDKNIAKGSTPLAEMHRLIEKDPRNAERIFPYIGGEEVNDSPTHAHHRYVINFEDMTEEEARQGWPDLMRLVEEKVKPARAHLTNNAIGRKRAVTWWQFASRASSLYQTTSNMRFVLVRALTSKHFSCFTFLPNSYIYDQTLLIFAFEQSDAFAFLNSRIHEVWSLFFGATMKDDPRYNLADCFENFVFPHAFECNQEIEEKADNYFTCRAELMVARDKGLTKTYNDFHDRAKRDPEIDELRRLHHEMDVAVLRAYGWDDLADTAAPDFLDATNEDEFAYQGRLFWPSAFRDEVLARLLALNADRHAEEVRQGIAPAAAAPAALPTPTEEEDAASQISTLLDYIDNGHIERHAGVPDGDTSGPPIRCGGCSSRSTAATRSARCCCGSPRRRARPIAATARWRRASSSCSWTASSG